MKIRTTIIALLVLASASAHGQEGIYIGIGVGSFDFEEGFVDPLYGRVSDSATGQKIFSGFDFNEFVGIEFSYLETGDLKANGSAVVVPFGTVTGALKTDFKIMSLRALGKWPLRWGTLFGGIGFFTSDNDFTEVLSAACCAPTTSGATISDNGFTGLLGVERYWGRFGAPWGVRLEYEWWDINDIDTSNLGIGFAYRF